MWVHQTTELPNPEAKPGHWKAEADKCAVGAGDLQQLDDTTKSRMNQDIAELNTNINYQDSMSMEHSLHPSAEYTKVLKCPLTLTDTDNILGPKTNINKFKRTAVTQAIMELK